MGTIEADPPTHRAWPIVAISRRSCGRYSVVLIPFFISVKRGCPSWALDSARIGPQFGLAGGGGKGATRVQRVPGDQAGLASTPGEGWSGPGRFSRPFLECAIRGSRSAPFDGRLSCWAMGPGIVPSRCGWVDPPRPPPGYRIVPELRGPGLGKLKSARFPVPYPSILARRRDPRGYRGWPWGRIPKRRSTSR